jgi:hypothetical protein
MDNSQHTLQDLSPDDARRTLGAIISPTGSGSSQLKHKAKWAAINTVIKPAILYPLVNIFFTEKDIQHLNSMTSRMKCLALGLNRIFEGGHFTWPHLSRGHWHTILLTKEHSG